MSTARIPSVLVISMVTQLTCSYFVLDFLINLLVLFLDQVLADQLLWVDAEGWKVNLADITVDYVLVFVEEQPLLRRQELA